MRKQIRYGGLAMTLALAAALMMTGCASSGRGTEPEANSGKSAPPPETSNVTAEPMRSTILDWNNRNMGVESFPAWLKALLVNNRQSVVRQEFSLGDNAVVRVSQAERTNREEARVLADLMFAQAIANELKRYVVTAAAANLDQGSMDIVEQIASSTKVTMTGGAKQADFWRYIEKDDNGVKSRSYVWYTVYAFPGETWNQLTRKYVNDVIGQLPNRPVQQQIANAFSEINAEAQRNNERSDAEFRQLLIQQQQAAEFQRQKELASMAAAADVAKTQVEAEAKARHEAYKSGNPVVSAAAAVTSADIDWIGALGTAASVIF